MSGKNPNRNMISKYNTGVLIGITAMVVVSLALAYLSVLTGQFDMALWSPFAYAIIIPMHILYGQCYVFFEDLAA